MNQGQEDVRVEVLTSLRDQEGTGHFLPLDRRFFLSLADKAGLFSYLLRELAGLDATAGFMGKSHSRYWAFAFILGLGPSKGGGDADLFLTRT